MADTNTKTYHEQLYIDDTLRLREILKTLPPFAKDYFRAVEPQTSARTRISYAYDIRVFFHFLIDTIYILIYNDIKVSFPIFNSNFCFNPLPASNLCRG